MVFNSDIFLFAFLPVVFIVFWAARTRQQRYIVLTISGYIFYGYWDWRFCLLLLFSSAVSFAAALCIQRARSESARRSWMAASVSIDLAVLGFFKYYNFFAVSVESIAPALALPVLNVVLPVGISFYTLHTISYIVDVYARRVEPTHNAFEYLAYVSLFSQLVAGPIVRYRQIEEDLEHVDRPLRSASVGIGLGFFAVGLLKKSAIADPIGAHVDGLLNTPLELSTTAAWLAALGYTFQLYYDFSGYSDMAVGLGHLFGMHIPQNFDAPYRALGPRDFWRRWHISLSTWLRDYLYIPLGGNRRGARRTDVNLMFTMLVGGLWHGANWTFVIWGAYHGALLVVEHHLEFWWSGVAVALRRAITFVLVVAGWVLFRAASVSDAGHWLAAMAGFGGGQTEAPIALLVLVALCLVAVNTVAETWDLPFGTSKRWAMFYALLFFVAYLFMNERKPAFLYYQF
jgi:alginate O-acetyltransferase complex protein AlgI